MSEYRAWMKSGSRMVREWWMDVRRMLKVLTGYAQGIHKECTCV